MKIEGNRTSKEAYFNNSDIKYDLKKKAIQGAGATVFSRASIYLVQLVGTVILARLLTPDDFGLVAMVTVISGIMIEFGVLRLAEATIQEPNISHKQISTLFWINTGLCLFLCVLLLAASPFIASFYGEPRLKLITIAISISFIFNGVTIQHIALLQRKFQFYRLATIQVAAVVVADIAAIIMAIKGYGYWSLVARKLALPVTLSIGSWVACSWRPSLPSKHSNVKHLILFGVNSLGNYFMNYCSRNFDKLLIGWRFGTQPLGQYDKAYHLFVMPVNQLTYPLTSVAVATLSRLRDDTEKFKHYYLYSISFLAFIGMAISLNLTVVGEDLMILLLGQQWLFAGKIFSVFGTGIGIMLIYGSHGWLHLSLGNADRWFYWGIFAFIVTIASFLIGLRYGTIGVAFGYTISFYVLLFPGLLYAGRPVGLTFSEIFNCIWKFYFSALIAALIAFAIMRNSPPEIYSNLKLFPKILLDSLLATTIYLSAVILLFRGTKPISDSFKIIRDMFPHKR